MLTTEKFPHNLKTVKAEKHLEASSWNAPESDRWCMKERLYWKDIPKIKEQENCLERNRHQR